MAFECFRSRGKYVSCEVAGGLYYVMKCVLISMLVAMEGLPKKQFLYGDLRVWHFPSA